MYKCINFLCDITIDKQPCEVLKKPDLFLGIIGNIFGYSVKDIYVYKKICWGKFYIGYYILFYAEIGCLLYLWFSYNLVLAYHKFGGACSNHEWYALYVFVVVVLGFIVQPLFLYLYNWLRRKQNTQEENTLYGWRTVEIHRVVIYLQFSPTIVKTRHYKQGLQKP